VSDILKAPQSLEMLETTHPMTRYYITEDLSTQKNRCENFKSCISNIGRFDATAVPLKIQVYISNPYYFNRMLYTATFKVGCFLSWALYHLLKPSFVWDVT